MNAMQFEPMSVGQILDRAFRLYRANFVRFIAITAVVQVPLTLLLIVIQQIFLVSAKTEADERMIGVVIGGSLITVFLTILAKTLANAALVKNISEAYLGNDVSVGEAYRFVLPRLGTLVWASIVVGAVVALGFVLLIVPGIIFSLWFALTSQIIVLEKLKTTPAMGRSRRLVSGNMGKTFLLGLVIGLIGMGVSLGVQALSNVIVEGATSSSLGLAFCVSQLLSLVGEILVLPISAAAFILLYYDLRIRKEGFDLEMLAQSLGTRPQEQSQEQSPYESPPAP